MGEIDDVLQELLGAHRREPRDAAPGRARATTRSRSRTRRSRPASGSLREERTVDLRNQPVALEVAAGRQVVQDDCATAYDDPAFHRMRETYGGLAAQIVTPVLADGRVEGIVSLHQLGSPRQWTDGGDRGVPGGGGARRRS